MPTPRDFNWAIHVKTFARRLASRIAGNRIEMSKAIIEITTSSSIRVKPWFVFFCKSPAKVPGLQFLFTEQINVNQPGITKTGVAVKEEHV